MKTLVTGGAGFIGSHLTDALMARGDEVWVVDDFSSGSVDNVPEGCNLMNFDISRGEVYEVLDTDFDLIFHLASHVGQELSFETPVRDFEVNALATSRIVTWAMAHGAPRIVFASSMNVYGDPLDGEGLVSEQTLPRPPSPYAVGKLASEQLLEVYEPLGLASASLRFFNVYGSRQDFSNLKQGMVSIFMSYVVAGQPVEVRGSLDRYRDFIHVSDVVAALLVASRPEAHGVYNVATSRKTLVRELIDLIVEACGKGGAEYPLIECPPTPRDQFGVVGDAERLRGLGWEPHITLEEGLTEMASWAITKHGPEAVSA